MIERVRERERAGRERGDDRESQRERDDDRERMIERVREREKHAYIK